MELNNSVQNIVLRAQQMRLKMGARDLHEEHILLVLLKCLDESLEDAPELSFKEMKAIDKHVSEWFSDQKIAIEKLEKGLEKNDVSLYGSGMAILERAGNIAPDGMVTIDFVMQAIGEEISPLMEEIMKGKEDPYATVAESSTLTRSRNERPSVSKESKVLLSDNHSDMRAAGDRPYHAGEEKKGNAQGEEGFTPSQFIALLELLAIAGGTSDKSEKSGKKHSHKRKIRGAKKRTKLGFITFRGGPAAAAIQYFLLSLTVPVLLLVGLDAALGWVTAPTALFQKIIVNLIVSFGIYFTMQGIVLLLGRVSNAFGNFLETFCELMLIYCIAASVATTQNLMTWPLRIRLGVSIVGILCLITRAMLYSRLEDQGRSFTITFALRQHKGSIGKIIFGQLGKSLILPATVLAVIWVFSLTLPGWLEKTLWILAFILHNKNVLIMWACLSARSDDIRYRKGRSFIKFCLAVRLYMTLVLLTFVLGGLFGWLPFRKWVWIILIVYTVLTFFVALIYAAEEKK